MNTIDLAALTPYWGRYREVLLLGGRRGQWRDLRRAITAERQFSYNFFGRLG